MAAHGAVSTQVQCAAQSMRTVHGIVHVCSPSVRGTEHGCAAQSIVTDIVALSEHLEHPGWHPWLNQRHPKLWQPPAASSNDPGNTEAWGKQETRNKKEERRKKKEERRKKKEGENGELTAYRFWFLLLLGQETAWCSSTGPVGIMTRSRACRCSIPRDSSDSARTDTLHVLIYSARTDTDFKD